MSGNLFRPKNNNPVYLYTVFCSKKEKLVPPVDTNLGGNHHNHRDTFVRVMCKGPTPQDKRYTIKLKMKQPKPEAVCVYFALNPPKNT